MDSSATLALIRKSRQHGGCGLGMGSRGFNKDRLAQVLMIGDTPVQEVTVLPAERLCVPLLNGEVALP